MITFIDVLTIVGMFALRVGVPILLILGLAYLLKRLDRRWEAEARLQAAQKQAVEQPRTLPKPADRPGQGVDRPGRQLPFDPTRPIPLVATAGQHCWDARNCTESQRATCAASAHPGLPCWQARFEADGRLPEGCFDCQMFQNQPGM